MADIPFRHAYLFNSYPSQICFMFLLLTFYRPGFIFLFNYFLLSIAVCHSSFFILLCHPLCFILCLCTPSLLLAAMFESCTTSLCFCFALFCFFFHPPPRCLFACYPHCESTLLGLAQRPEDIRDNPGTLLRKATGG